MKGLIAFALMLGSLASSATAAPAGMPHPNHVRVEHSSDATSPSIGRRDAPVTVELFIVAGASASRAPVEALRQLQREHPSRVRLVVRLLARDGINIAVAALEAHAQGLFWPFFDLVSRRGNLSRERLSLVATQVGLNVGRLQRAWDEGLHREELAANEARRLRYQVGSPPDALFSGRPTRRGLTALGGDDLEALYEEAYLRTTQSGGDGLLSGLLAPASEAKVIHVLRVTDEGDEVPANAVGHLLPRVLRLNRDRIPSIGSPNPGVTIIVACNLLHSSCFQQLEQAAETQRMFPDAVLVQWAPSFPLEGEDAGTRTLFHDAALCGDALAGWSWILESIRAGQRDRNAGVDAWLEQVRDATAVAPLAHLECLAARAGDSAWIAARLRALGMRTTPTVIVGGRSYPGGFVDARSLQQTVADELVPGLLGKIAGDATIDP